MKTFICETCGIAFERNRKEQRFCSVKCRGQIGGKQRAGEVIVCPICGKEKYFPQFRLKDTTNFCSKECQWESMKKPKKPYYKQCGHKGGNALQHRVIMEGIIGRPLLTTEVVHHKNGDTLDNRVDNLQLLSNRDHAILHAKMRREQES